MSIICMINTHVDVMILQLFLKLLPNLIFRISFFQKVQGGEHLWASLSSFCDRNKHFVCTVSRRGNAEIYFMVDANDYGFDLTG